MIDKEQYKKDLEHLPQGVRDYINQLERVRKDFVANVSHELRTPLTVIKGYLESLSESPPADLETLKPIWEQMLHHSIRMENIIKDLLFLSQLESDICDIERQEDVMVASMLETLCADAKNISGVKKHQIKLTADPTLYLNGSSGELKSLFSNMIINAVKYTEAGGQIDVRWQLSGDNALFSVTDNGIGIDEKDIQRITERFYRVEKGRSRESGGTGLGLAIVKHVLVRHEGELNITSQLGQGSCFCCRFPKNRAVVIKTS
jgi:two-component system, OmpR family, phosphate regulon sensor histidine kinase PhoR